MALLLDTNIVLWFYTSDERLSNRVSERLMSGDDMIFISAVSAWEYYQKRRKRPTEFPQNFDQVTVGLPHFKLGFAFDLGTYAQTLPPIHKDPFDRMLIAQAIHHDLEFVASDAAIHRYPVRTFW